MLNEHPSIVVGEYVVTVEAAETFEVQNFDEVAGGGGCPLLVEELIAVGVESKEVLLAVAAGDAIAEESRIRQPLCKFPVGHAEARLQLLPVHVPRRNF